MWQADPQTAKPDVATCVAVPGVAIGSGVAGRSGGHRGSWRARATGFATSSDLDALIGDPTVDLVDICLPTSMHAEISHADQQLRRAAAEHRYRALETLEFENRTALLWPGYDLAPGGAR